MNADQGLFFCHGCKAKGDIFDFEAERSGCSRKAAKRRLAGLVKGAKGMRHRIDATHPYLSESGTHLYDQVRFDPKGFAFRRPDGRGGWIWNLKGVELVPYRLPEALKAKEVWIAEGEKDVETLRSLGFTATCNPGGAGKWSDRYSKYLKGKRVRIVQDNDEPGRAHARQVAESAAKYAEEVKVLPLFKGAKDVTEWVEKSGTRKRLLKLAARTPSFNSPGSGHPSESFKAPRGDVLVWRLERFFKRYLVLPNGIAFVLALWVIATHLFERFDSFGYLVITSPTKRCGKTRLAEVLCMVCARARMTANISEAALFRTTDHFKPTLIIDEAELLNMRNSERWQALRSIINAGHRPGNPVVRCVGKSFEPTEFEVYGPKVISVIGDVPDTIRDRSILIPMRRKRADENVKRFRFRQAKLRGRRLAELTAAWAEKWGARVQKAYEAMELPFLGDREADIWDPLFAVASVGVPAGLGELRKTSLRLSAEKGRLDTDDSEAIALLSDLRRVFANTKAQKIATNRLIGKLTTLPETRWDGLTPTKMAKLLSPFKIAPAQQWINECNLRGYALEDLKPVFETYVPRAAR